MLWLAIPAALIFTLLLTPITIKLAHKLGAVDIPNERKVHQGAKPRIGGLAIYFGFVVGALLLGQYSWQVAGLLIGATLVMLGGFYDDLKGISPKGKLLIQLVAALILIKCGYCFEFITNPFTGGVISLGFLAVPLTLIWLIGISNAINLVDGLDGLSAGISAIAAATMSVVCYSQGNLLASGLAAVLAAAAFGFLRYNFFPSKTFMGDCGSLFLGFCLGAIAVLGLSKGATMVSIFIPLIILGIPIFDTMFAIIRRLFQHKSIFEADKGHLHHCLLGLGLSHANTVLVIYAISFLMGLCAVLMAVLTTPQAIVLLILITVFTFIGADALGVLRGKGVLQAKKQQHSK